MRIAPACSCTALLILTATALAQNSDPTLGGLPEKTLESRWTVLFAPSGNPRVLRRYASHFNLDAPTPIQFNGPGGDPNLIGEYKPGGVFSVTPAELAAPSDHEAAIHLLTGSAFEFEGIVDAGGTGGFWILMGWTGKSGYLLHQVTLRTSETWTLYRYENDRFQRMAEQPTGFRWGDGFKPMSVSVSDGELSVRIGDGFVVHDLELPGYTRGQVVIGTSRTSYGPKRLIVRSLRARSIED